MIIRNEGQCPHVIHLKKGSVSVFIISNLTLVTLPKNVLLFTLSIISK